MDVIEENKRRNLRKFIYQTTQYVVFERYVLWYFKSRSRWSSK